MDSELGVIVVFGALGVWAALLALGTRSKRWGMFLGFGILLMLYLNLRYFIDGAPSSIAFFIGIYDVLDNVGLSSSDTVDGMAPCVDNACTVWGDRYQQHPSWGVAFHDRFLNGPQWRTNLLYGHIGANTIAFVLMHVQLWRPGVGVHRDRHRLLGRVSFAAVSVGTLCAVLLAAEHGSVEEYRGWFSTFGFWFMSFCVYGCAVMMVRTIRAGDVQAHRKWTIWFVGSMWGSFWLFRVILFVLDPLLRNVEALALQIVIWGSAPLGIWLAEQLRRRGVAVVEAQDSPETEPALS